MHGRAEAFRLCLAEGAFEGSVPIFYHTPHFVLQCETVPALNFAEEIRTEKNHEWMKPRNVRTENKIANGSAETTNEIHEHAN